MLKTKLTALCAALLLGVAVCLSAAMLWQVREQAYGSLLQNSEETLEDLLSNFDAPAFRALSGESTAAAQRAQLIYAFRSCGVPGSALLVGEECLYAATPIHPESYLDLSGTGEQSVRAQVQGRHFLILGKTVDIRQTRCGIYLVRDADDIHARLWQLGGRFALLLNVNTLQTVYLPEEKQAALLDSMDSQLHWLETMVKKLLTLLSLQKNAKLAKVSVPVLKGQGLLAGHHRPRVGFLGHFGLV